MTRTCFVCNTCVGDTEKGSDSNIFAEYTNLSTTLLKLLEEVFEKTIPNPGLHSNVLCKTCYKSCMEYDNLRTKLKNIKTDLVNRFKTTLPKYGYNFTNYPNKAVVVKPLNKIVLPASKLQPLPPDYVVNVANLQNKWSPNKICLPKIVNVTSTSPSINLKVTVGSSVLTQTIKTTQNTTQKVTTAASENTSASLSSILNTNTSNSMVNFNIDSLPKDFLSGAVLTKVTGKNNVKCEDDELNNDENPMEIDEDCTTLVQVTDEGDLLNIENEEGTSSEKSQYFDVSLLTEGATNDTILGKLEILDQDGEEDNEEGETIVMAGENGSILRIMSGKKLVYENGEITLATDDDNSNQDDNQDGQDSNDEAQIELQVSGDEETANAIIAAAQEQGGAFIKVESGEMFRVKSVHSKSGTGITDEGASSMVCLMSNGDFKCTMCENNEQTRKYFSGDARQIVQHIKTEHLARLYICELCKKVMRKRNEYTAHLEEHSSQMNNNASIADKSKLHECTLCNKKYTSRTLLQEHMNMHNGTRPYSCAVCNKSFASKYTHQSHLKTHLERPRPFKCKTCFKSFFSQQNLNQHQRTHLGIKDFICNVCGKGFGTQHNLEVHAVVHSGKKPYVCGVCAKGFARRAEVKDHMRIHTGERPYSCDVCGAAFSQRSNLHSHKRATHMDDRRYHCTDCPKKFKRRRLLDYHMKATHTGVRPLVCEVCHATFVYPEHYKKHVRIHSGEKPYVCEVCGKSFNSRDNRNTHRFVHSDKKPYECLVCGAGYMRKQLLYAHMNTTGHLAESIVVNQPRVQKISDKGKRDSSQPNKDRILEPIQEFTTTECSSEADSTPKLYFTEDKKLILQDGKSTINLVSETDDPTLLTFIQNLEGGSTIDSQQIISADNLGEEVQVITTDENGDIKLVKLHIKANVA